MDNVNYIAFVFISCFLICLPTGYSQEWQRFTAGSSTLGSRPVSANTNQQSTTVPSRLSSTFPHWSTHRPVTSYSTQGTTNPYTQRSSYHPVLSTTFPPYYSSTRRPATTRGPTSITSMGTTPTTRMLSDQAVQAEFELNYDYDNFVGRDRTAWETRNRREIASAAGVILSRITSFALTETSGGKIMAAFEIQPGTQSSDIATERAKDNIKRKVENRTFRLRSPAGQPSAALRPVGTSFEWNFVMPSTTTTTTTTTTTPPPSDQDIFVQFTFLYNYATSVGRDRAAWELRNRPEIATAAGVDELRITQFALTEGSIVAGCIIEARSRSSEIPTEVAKDNIQDKVARRQIRLRSPPNLPSSSLLPDASSFKWTFIFNQPIYVTFRLTATYSTSVGRNRTAWEMRNLQELATSAGISELRITNFTLTDSLGRINASCEIEPPTEETDIPAEFAKDNLEKSIETRTFRLRAPTGYSPSYVYPYTNSFEWWYINRPSSAGSESKKDSDDFETYFILIIAIGAFVLLLLVVAIVVIWYKTRKVERKLTEDLYDSAPNSDIFITPSDTVTSAAPEQNGVDNATYDSKFDY